MNHVHIIVATDIVEHTVSMIIIKMMRTKPQDIKHPVRGIKEITQILIICTLWVR